MSVPVCDPESLSRAKKFLFKEHLLYDYDNPNQTLMVIPFNCEPLDSVTGVGGLPRGRIIEISGHESSGKSTIALELCREELHNNTNSICVYLDFEFSLSKPYLENLGLMDPAIRDRFVACNVTTVEDAEKVVSQFVDTGQVPSLVVVDSVAAMIPNSSTERDFDKAAEVGAQARRVTQLLGRWVAYGRKHGICFLLLNQLRSKIKTDKFDSGKPIPGIPGSENDVTPGGRALAFFASMRMRLDVRSTYNVDVLNPKTNEKEKIPIANWVKMTCYKNKVANPHGASTFYIEYGKGVNFIRTLIEHAKKQNVITSAGSYLKFAFGDKEYKAQGVEKLVLLLEKDAEATQALKELLGWDNSLDLASGEISEIAVESDTSFEVTRDILAEAEAATTVVERAIKLGLIERHGSQYVYTHDGSETRGKTEEVLTRRLPPEAVKALESKVSQTMDNLRQQCKEAV